MLSQCGIFLKKNKCHNQAFDGCKKNRKNNSHAGVPLRSRRVIPKAFNHKELV
jgi:hypothetical protein